MLLYLLRKVGHFNGKNKRALKIKFDTFILLVICKLIEELRRRVESPRGHECAEMGAPPPTVVSASGGAKDRSNPAAPLL
jgi:hypothetical protein